MGTDNKRFRTKVLPNQTCYHVLHGEGKYGDEHLKDIGLFSSRKLAEETVNRLKSKPGFNEFGKFTISKCVIDRVAWGDGFIVIEDV